MTPRAIGYVRVSKAREEMISPELQVTAITDWCQRSGAALASIITDLDATGRNFAREGIQQAISRVEAGEASIVVVWKWSRFGRNVRDCLINIDRLEAAGGRLVAATEDFDDTPVGRFGRGQFLLMAQFESERIGEQWKEAQGRRLRNGLPYNGRPRYGYTYSRENGYQPDPVTGPVLAEMFQRYCAGESCPRIANDFNRRGIPAPQGGWWYGNTLQQVMETGFAAGLLRVNTRTGPQRKSAVPRYEPGSHPAIIGMDLWERYLRKRELNKAAAPTVRAPKHAFAGLLVCGTCGRPMHRASGPERIICSTARTHLPCPQRAHTRLRVIEKAVKEWLAGIATEVDIRTSALQDAKAGQSDRRRHARALTREITRLEASLTRLTRQFAEGTIPDQAYITARDQITREKRHHELELLRVTEDMDTAASPRVAPSLLRDWPTLDALGQREVLSALISRITVHPRGRGRQPLIVITPKWSTDQE